MNILDILIIGIFVGLVVSVLSTIIDEIKKHE